MREEEIKKAVLAVLNKMSDEEKIDVHNRFVLAITAPQDYIGEVEYIALDEAVSVLQINESEEYGTFSWDEKYYRIDSDGYVFTFDCADEKSGVNLDDIAEYVAYDGDTLHLKAFEEIARRYREGV